MKRLLSAIGTFLKCHPWWVMAAYDLKADSGRLVRGAFMSSRPREELERLCVASRAKHKAA